MAGPLTRPSGRFSTETRPSSVSSTDWGDALVLSAKMIGSILLNDERQSGPTTYSLVA